MSFTHGIFKKNNHHAAVFSAFVAIAGSGLGGWLDAFDAHAEEPAPLATAAAITSTTAPAAAPASSRSPSKGALNPDISANMLLLYNQSNLWTRPDTELPNGLLLQETELQLTADVDTHFRATSVLSVHPSEEPGAGRGSYELEPEELYFETLGLSLFTFRLGKMKAAFGKHNTLHTHAFPLIDAPLTQSEFFGPEGFNDLGISVAALLPLPWYSELVYEGYYDSHGPWSAEDGVNVLALLRLKNLRDLSDSTTVELGLSGASGKNRWDHGTSAKGADVTLKWRPTESVRGQSVAWTTEYLSWNQAGGDSPVGDALSSWVQYQYHRVFAVARGEWSGLVRSEGALPKRKQSFAVGVAPSEFSAMRLQYDHVGAFGERPVEHRVALQWNLSIGAHPAHAY